MKKKFFIAILVIASLIAGASILAITHTNTNPKAEAECSAEAEAKKPCTLCGQFYCEYCIICNKCYCEDCRKFLCFGMCDCDRCPDCYKLGGLWGPQCICWLSCVFCGNLKCGVTWPCVLCDNPMCMCLCVAK